MPSSRRTLETRARDAILKSIIANYKKQKTDWLKEPAIRKAILTYSMFRTENALIIAAIILMSGCATTFLLSPLGWVAGLAAGGLGGIFTLTLVELLFLYRSLKNETLHTDAVAGLFESKVNFKPGYLKDKELATKVKKALDYWSLIDDAVEKSPKGVLRDRLENTTQEATHWLQAVYNLAERVDKFHANNVIKQDLQTVPLALADYRLKLTEEDNPEVRRQLERTIADKERQLRILEDLQNSMEKADYQLDSTISALGTIYSQLLLVGNKEEEGSRLKRLQEEISEQVYRLEDLAEAMDEVYTN